MLCEESDKILKTHLESKANILNEPNSDQAEIKIQIDEGAIKFDEETIKFDEEIAQFNEEIVQFEEGTIHIEESDIKLGK